MKLRLYCYTEIYIESTGEVLRENIYIGGHFLSVRNRGDDTEGLRTSPRSPLVLFLPTALCSTA